MYYFCTLVNVVAICFYMFYAEDHMLDKCTLNMLSSQNKDILLFFIIIAAF